MKLTMLGHALPAPGRGAKQGAALVPPRPRGRRAGVVLALAALLYACGGGNGDGDPRSADPGFVVVTPNLITVVQGESVTVRVDVELLPPGDQANNYQIGFAEESTRINIGTAPCADGTGTSSCRLWTFTPALDAVPGDYGGFGVRAAGTRSRVLEGGFSLRVLPKAYPEGAVSLATRSHVITTDGRLYGTGPGTASGVSLRSVGFDPDVPLTVPQFVIGYVRVGDPADTWRDVATGRTATVAVKSDGTVWTWGDNPDNRLAVESGGLPQLAPKQIAGLTGATQVSVLSTPTEGDRFVVLADAIEGDGRVVKRVHAWGGDPRWVILAARPDRDPPVYDDDVSKQPQVLPQAVDEDNNVERLGGAAALAGATSNSGSGMLVVRKDDGSVWQLGWQGGPALDGKFVEFQGPPPGIYRAGRAMAKPVLGLPGGGLPPGANAEASVAVATVQLNQVPPGEVVERDGYEYYGLAIGHDGQLYWWTRANPTATVVPGLDHIVQIDADPVGGRDATQVALRRDDGSVWTWRLGSAAAPQPAPTLPAMRRLAKGAPELSIAGNCGAGGSLWRRGAEGAGRVGSFGLSSGAGLDCELPGAASVTFNVTGPGSVQHWPGIYPVCEGTCTLRLPADTEHGAYAMPQAGHRANDWTCDAPVDTYWLGPGISFRPTDGMRCSVTFSPAAPAQPAPVPLTVRVSGALGRVVSIPAGIDCSAECTHRFGAGTTVRLVPQGALTTQGTTTFVRWDGDPACSDAGVSMDAARACTAVFTTLAPPSLPLSSTIAVSVTGSGSVTSQPAGIACPGDCTETLARDIYPSVTLTATPGAGQRFTGWGGACNGGGNAASVSVPLDADRACSASFEPAVAQNAVLNVQVAGAAGSVSSAPAGIACPGACSAGFLIGQTVTLSAAPVAPNVTQWSGTATGCSGNAASVQLTLGAATQDCEARFVPPPADLRWRALGAAPAPTGALGRPAIAVDAAGQPTLAYTVDVADVRQLLVKRFDGAQWVQLGAGALNAAGTSAFSPSIVLRADGLPVVAWWEGSGAVRVSIWNGAAWVSLSDNLVIGGAGVVGSKPQLALFGNQLVAAWMQFQGTTARLALKRYDLNAGGDWAGGFVPDVGAGSDLDLRLALDAAGRATLLYVRVSAASGELAPRAVEETPTGWQALCNDVAPGSGQNFANLTIGFGIQRDTDGAAVAWVTASDFSGIQARRCNGVAWQFSDGGSGDGLALAVNNASAPLESIASVAGAARPTFAYTLNTGYRFGSLLGVQTLRPESGHWGFLVPQFEIARVGPSGALAAATGADGSPVLANIFEGAGGAGNSVLVHRYGP